MVSIIVPIYNTAEYLERCIMSLINQTYEDIEIVLVDDGSSDGSGKICDEMKLKDKRIKVIHQHNQGEAEARNTGIKNASGNYICFIDSDDEYYYDAIENLLNTLMEANADASVGGYMEVYSDNKKQFAIPHMQEYLPEDIAREVLIGKGTYGDSYIFSTVNGKLFKKSIIDEKTLFFNKNYVVGNDSIFFGNYISGIGKVVNTFTAVYKYYKYDINERVQGMSWFYPDAFVLSAVVSDIMLRLLDDDTITEKEIVLRYMSTIYGLMNLISYQNDLKFDIWDYIVYLAKNVSILRKGAELESKKGIIVDKNKWGIPFDIVSYMICREDYIELSHVLEAVNEIQKPMVNRARKRRIIKLTDGD